MDSPALDYTDLAAEWSRHGEELVRAALQEGEDEGSVRDKTFFAGGSLYAALRIAGAGHDRAEAETGRFFERIQRVYDRAVPDHQRVPRWKH